MIVNANSYYIYVSYIYYIQDTWIFNKNNCIKICNVILDKLEI